MHAAQCGFLIAIAFAAPVRAETPEDVLKFLRNAADALTNEDARTFLDHADRNMPVYATLQRNIEGLMAAYDVESSIEIANDEGDDQKRTLTLDWVLITEQKSDTRGDRMHRRQLLRCTIEKQGKRWKITALDPVDFFKY